MLRISNKGYTALIIFVFGLLFIAQDWWFISDWDDIFYKFITTDPNIGTVPQLMRGGAIYVNTLSDIITSQLNHYMGNNGRFVVHCIVQYCTSFLTHHQFAILNSIVFTFLIWGMVKLSDKRFSPKNGLFVCVSLAILSPLTMGDFFNNIAWSVNYLWSAMITIWWLRLYEYVTTRKNRLSTQYLIGISFISFLVGSLQESFCIGLSAALVLYHVVNYKTLNCNKVSVVVGYLVGASVCILSPANWKKADDANKGLSIDAILDLLTTYSIILFCVLLLVCFICSRNKFREYVKANAVLILTFAFTISFALFYVYNGSRQYTLSTLLSIILSVRIFNCLRIRGFNIIQKSVIVLGLLLFFVYYPEMYHLRKNIGVAYYNIVGETVKNKNRIVINDSYEIARQEIENNVLNKYFRINALNGSRDSRYMSLLVSDGSDANYIEAVLPIAIEDMRSLCKEDYKIVRLYNNIYAYSSKYKYMLDEVVLEYKTTFRNPNRWHDFNSNPEYRVEHDGKYYYIFHIGKGGMKDEVIIINNKGQNKV